MCCFLVSFALSFEVKIPTVPIVVKHDTWEDFLVEYHKTLEYTSKNYLLVLYVYLKIIF